MTDDMEFSPWVEHDGAAPKDWPCRTIWPHAQLQVVVSSPDQIHGPDVIGNFHPGLFWRWRKVRTGWLTHEMRRVCDDPAYAPIIRYRFFRPRPRAAALDRLADIVANPSQPITGPEGPIRRLVPQEVRP